MKRYKIYPETTSVYFCTSTIIECQCVFKTEQYAQIIEKWFNEKMKYMHANPVQKRFLVNPEAWKYSSAGNWILDRHDVISLDLNER
ncbi:hypothetical protein JW835_05645 [bacterium]|nr:hypothetical protein [bacterium]